MATETGAAPDAVEMLTHRHGRLVCRATLPSGAEVVVKVTTSAGQFAAEVAAVAVLKAAGLPVSRVRAVRDGPPSVIVLDWTPGRAIGADDNVPLRHEVLEILGKVHRLPAAPPYGGVNPDLVTWIDGWCHHALHWWARRGEIDPTGVGVARRWYRRVRPLIAGRAGSMIMMDAPPDHFIVGPGDRVRLIDVAELQPGDPVMDLAVLSLHAPGILAGLLDRYDQAELDDRHLSELLPFYVFLRAVAAAQWSAHVLDPAGCATWLSRAATELRRAPREP
ncbi:phosphotransferase [Actinoplanes ianthinogenes]|uniref:phosphotransferase n=1 Tax=Actinoplanes ianthinogenes TaxID=122358 RepID=UPI0016710A76|nr:phosphotransferase [Actinoplanes ianthinogenes]